jgi:hypothetical protein
MSLRNKTKGSILLTPYTLILMEWRPEWAAKSRLPQIGINAVANEWALLELRL